MIRFVEEAVPTISAPPRGSPSEPIPTAEFELEPVEAQAPKRPRGRARKAGAAS